MIRVTESDEPLLIPIGDAHAQIHVRSFRPESPQATLFYLHEFTGNSAEFQDAGRFLAAHGYSVICPDMPGRGNSAYLPADAYSLRNYLDVLAHVFQTHAGGRNILLGRGWGGVITLLFASWMRPKIARIIVSDVSLTWTLERDGAIQQAIADKGFSFADEAAGIAHILAHLRLQDLPVEAATAYARARLKPDPGGYRLHQDDAILSGLQSFADRKFDLAGVIAAQPCPVTLLHGGAQDPLPAGLNNGNVSIVRHCGHMGAPVHLASTAQILTLFGLLNASALPADIARLSAKGAVSG